jgi:maleylacetoacetate isomerase
VSKLRLYSYWRSSASHRVRIALQLKGLEYEYVPVHLTAGGGEQYSAAYRALNPQSRVPTLEVGGVVLTQSMAIMEWLEETHPEPPLLPRDPMQRARVRAMAQLLVADVQPLQNNSVARYLQEHMHQDDGAVDAWRRHWVSRGLAALEEMLKGDREGDCCVGTNPTLADACLLAQCASAHRFGVDTAAYPRIARIEKACNANPAFQRAAPAAQPDATA